VKTFFGRDILTEDCYSSEQISDVHKAGPEISKADGDGIPEVLIATLSVSNSSLNKEPPHGEKEKDDQTIVCWFIHTCRPHNVHNHR
jgi:hypothetical protein